MHCVQGTKGAELHPSLDRAKVDVVVDTGQDPNSQGYSAFQDTRLGDLLRAHDVDRLYVVGLTTDYCVKHTVLDARREGFDVTVVEDAIRGVEVEPGDSDRAIEEMRRAGAEFAPAEDIAPTRLASRHRDPAGKAEPGAALRPDCAHVPLARRQAGDPNRERVLPRSLGANGRAEPRLAHSLVAAHLRAAALRAGRADHAFVSSSFARRSGCVA